MRCYQCSFTVLFLAVGMSMVPLPASAQLLDLNGDPGAVMDNHGDSHIYFSPEHGDITLDIWGSSIVCTGDSIRIRVLTEDGAFVHPTLPSDYYTFQVPLDIDQDPATGIQSGSLQGADYHVHLNTQDASLILSETWTWQGDYSVTTYDNGLEAIIPLSAMGGDDGLLDYRVNSSIYLGGGASTFILDYIPDAGPATSYASGSSGLYWTGASGDDAGFAGNWADDPIGTIAVSPPNNTTDVTFDTRLDPSAPEGGYWGDHYLVSIDSANDLNTGNVTVMADYHFNDDYPYTYANWNVHGGIDIVGDGRMVIDGKMTVDLRPAGAEGDMHITSTEYLPLIVHQGNLYVDELIVDTTSAASFSNDSSLSARYVEVGAGGELKLYGGNHNVTQKVLVNGTLYSNGDAGFVAPLVEVSNGGTLQIYDSKVFYGNTTASVYGDVDNAGTLIIGSLHPTPSSALNTGTIDGNYTQLSTASLVCQIAGTLPEDGDSAVQGYEYLHVKGDADLAGTLDVSLSFGFTLQMNQVFNVLRIDGTQTGQFDGLIEGDWYFNDPATGVDLFITYTGGDGNDVCLVSLYKNGDSNTDLRVDANDLARIGLNWSPTGTDNTWGDGDYDGDGDVDADDLAQIGLNWSPGGYAATPEPASLSLLAFGALTLCRRNRR